MSLLLALAVLLGGPGIDPAPGLMSVPIVDARVTRPARTAPGPRRAAVGGWATWFAAPRGTAAAGPALRAALGRSWRGRPVTVWLGSRHTTVRLTDWCACGPRSGSATLLDLSASAFAALAPLSRGVQKVTVSW
jgi:hypothetical protein